MEKYNGAQAVQTPSFDENKYTIDDAGLKKLMELDIMKAVTSVGFSEKAIKSALKNKLEKTRQPFFTLEPCIEAIIQFMEDEAQQNVNSTQENSNSQEITVMRNEEDIPPQTRSSNNNSVNNVEVSSESEVLVQTTGNSDSRVAPESSNNVDEDTIRTSEEQPIEHNEMNEQEPMEVSSQLREANEQQIDVLHEADQIMLEADKALTLSGSLPDKPTQDDPSTKSLKEGKF